MTSSHLVVVLNWHGRNDTIECVASLLDDPDLAVLVVDNGSFDGALDAVAGDRVDALQLPRNLGFAGGMNRGIEWGLEQGNELITVLNNDTIVPAGAMARIRDATIDDRIVSPTVMYRDRPEEAWFAGGSIDRRLGYAHHTTENDLEPCVDGIRPSEVLAGCCVTAQASTWRRVGLFDERFFLNFEDSEWSLRARRLGAELGVICDARILHAVSASFVGAAATLGTYYFIRNGMLFSRLAGAPPAARIRFLRRFAPSGLREASWRARRRRLVIVGWAVVSYVFRRYGEAPAPLRMRAAKWADGRNSRSADRVGEVGEDGTARDRFFG